jgi:hypothetical protein
MSKKIWIPLAAAGAVIATGGLASIGIPGLLGAGGAAAAGGAGAAGAAGGGLSGATLASLAGTGANVAGNIYAQRRQGKAADQALAFEREQEARRRLEYDQSQLEQRRQWDAEQRNREPYRQQSLATLSRIARRPTAGGTVRDFSAFQPGGAQGSLATLGRR